VKRQLKGRRIAVLAADGFEKVELTIPVKALKLAGAKVDIVSLHRGHIRGVNLHEPASRVRVNKRIEEVDTTEYDCLLIPGGFINPDLLRQSVEVREFVREFARSGRPIASLCHGPWVLASADVLEGRVLTSWPGVRDDMVHAGATWVNEAFVEDGNLVTSRGPQDLLPFIRGIIRHFTPGASMRRHPMVQSSPQAVEPPGLVIGAMRWLPKASTRAALLTMGGLTLGALAMASRRETPRLEQRAA
jgi:protease I